MTYPEALRAYADWMEAHAELHIEKGTITLYNNDSIVPELIREGAVIEDPGASYEIAYVRLNEFLPLKLEFVVRREVLMQPSIQNGEVVWVLKPEFDTEAQESLPPTF
jgi:hypothetical protein